MEDRLLAVVATAKPRLAKVVRDFVGSRIEKQVVAHAVDVAWKVAAAKPVANSTVTTCGPGGATSGEFASLMEGASV